MQQLAGVGMQGTSWLIMAAVVVAIFALEWAYNRLIRPKRATRWVKQKIAGIQAGKSPPDAKRSKFCIVCDETRVGITENRPDRDLLRQMNWSDIQQVIAFKRDLYVVDCICIALIGKDQRVIEVDEEMKGWETLTESLPVYLEGCKQWHECFVEIAFPAFAANQTVLFDRARTKNGN